MLSSPAFARHIEAHRITTHNTTIDPTFKTITFIEPFGTVPIVVSTASNEGTDPADLRIRNVTTTGFEISPVETASHNGGHDPMTVDYIAIEAGITTLPDGTVIVAGFHDTSSTVAGANGVTPNVFDTVIHSAPLTNEPGVIASIQTMNNEENNVPAEPSVPFLSVAVGALQFTNKFWLSLERSETVAFPNASTPLGSITVPETIGWIAFPNGTAGRFTDTSGNSIGWDARITADNITGDCVENPFTASSWPNARVVGTREGRDGGDGGWMRRCNITNTTVSYQLEEDIVRDTEQGHTAENISLLSFSDSFHADLQGAIIGSKDIEMVNSADYSLPGNEVRYRLSAESVGNSAIDADTVMFTDALPDEVILKIADIDGTGSGPVRFVDGSPASGLAYQFDGLSSTSDNVYFSNDDGATFDYIPVDDGSGFDANITHIRISTTGNFLSATGSGLPSFAVEFDAIIR